MKNLNDERDSLWHPCVSTQPCESLWTLTVTFLPTHMHTHTCLMHKFYKAESNTNLRWEPEWRRRLACRWPVQPRSGSEWEQITVSSCSFFDFSGSRSRSEGWVKTYCHHRWVTALRRAEKNAKSFGHTFTSSRACVVKPTEALPHVKSHPKWMQTRDCADTFLLVSLVPTKMEMTNASGDI